MSHLPRATALPALAGARPGRLRAACAWLASLWARCARRRTVCWPTVSLLQISESELRDIGVPPEVFAEAHALREFERQRDRALTHGGW